MSKLWHRDRQRLSSGPITLYVSKAWAVCVLSNVDTVNLTPSVGVGLHQGCDVSNHVTLMDRILKLLWLESWFSCGIWWRQLQGPFLEGVFGTLSWENATCGLRTRWRDYLYTGLGKVSIKSWWMEPGRGIFKSVDCGWTDRWTDNYHSLQSWI